MAGEEDLTWFLSALEDAFRSYAKKVGVKVSELWAQFDDDPYSVREAVDGLDWEGDIAKPYKKKFGEGVRKTHGPAMNRTAAEHGVAVTFGPAETSVYAEVYVREHGAELVTNINEGTRQAIKETISDGVLRGHHPKQIARRLREQVGLLPSHARAVENYRARLLEKGTPLGRVNKMSKKYADKLLRYRAKNIARTEARAARNQARLDSWSESIQKGYLDPGARKVWVISPYERTCPICRGELDGKSIPVQDFWETTSGLRLARPPAHPSCRCTMNLIPG